MKDRPRILCVDDEAKVLEGLHLHLRKAYDVHLAGSGPAGLELIQAQGPFAVVFSDMRMPVMDGAAFLGRVRTLAPDTVRILLTGYADLDSAIAAINEGQIFRFLTKPCPPEVLRTTCEAAVRQYDLISAERILLEQTLRGVIKMLTDVLSLANPVAFGRANRLKRHASELAQKLGVTDLWQIEVAALLSQLGCITLSPETLDKLYLGRALTDKERPAVARLPEVTEQLLGGIPRLEPVLAILRSQDKPCKPGTALEATLVGGHLLKIATDFDVLISQGNTAQIALDTMRGRRGQYDAAIFDAFVAIQAPAGKRSEIKEVSITALQPGMVLAEDVRMRNGALLVPKGYEVTPSFIGRVENYYDNLTNKSVKVVIPPGI